MWCPRWYLIAKPSWKVSSQELEPCGMKLWSRHGLKFWGADWRLQALELSEVCRVCRGQYWNKFAMQMVGPRVTLWKSRYIAYGFQHGLWHHTRLLEVAIKGQHFMALFSWGDGVPDQDDFCPGKRLKKGERAGTRLATWCTNGFTTFLLKHLLIKSLTLYILNKFLQPTPYSP